MESTKKYPSCREQQWNTNSFATNSSWSVNQYESLKLLEANVPPSSCQYVSVDGRLCTYIV